MKHSHTLITLLFLIWFLPLSHSLVYPQCIPSLSYNSENTLCENDSVSLVATINLPSGCEFTPGFPFIWNGSSAPPPTASNAITIISASSGTYTVQVNVQDDGSGNCPCVGLSPSSNSIIVKPRPNSPSVISTSGCPGQSFTLTPFNHTEGKLAWYDQPSGGNLLFVGNPFITPPLSTHTNYYVEEVLEGCESSLRTPASVSVWSIPSPLSVTSETDSICAGESTILSASTGGASGFFYWYTDIAATNLVHIGNHYTTPPLTTTTTYYVSEVLRECNSPLVPLTITVIPPVNLAVNDINICAGETATLTVPSYPDGVQWYASPTGTALLDTTPSYVSPPLSQTTTYYAEIDSLKCNRRIPFTVNVRTALLAHATITQEISCFGDSNGIASIVASGGTSPYTYIWGDGSLGATHTNLSKGVFGYHVIDSWGCTTAQNITLAEPEELILIVSSIIPTSTPTGNGQAFLRAVGGKPPYTFSMGSNNTSSLSLTLPIGSHTVSVTDANGCTSNMSFLMYQASN